MNKRTSLRPVFAMLAGIVLVYFTTQIIDTPKVNTPVGEPTTSSVNVRDTLLPFPEQTIEVLSAPTLTSKSGGKKGVLLHTLKINASIKEQIAVTRYEMTFFNPNGRDLEAELNFPLAEGQVITYFAMDVNGKLRPGVAVEKERARVAFESTIRQNIDPGLVEMTKGNNFKARVFPVPGKGYKRIIIEYTEELYSRNELAHYYLPLGFNDKVHQFDLLLEVNDPKTAPRFLKTNNSGIQFAKVQHLYRAEVHKSSFTPKDPLAIEITVPSNSTTGILAKHSEETYFHTSLQIPNRFREKPAPRSITVLWDVSGSSSDQRNEMEIQLLTSYLASIGRPTVEIVPFANDILPSKKFYLKGKDTAAVSAYLNHLDFDGGSNISCIPFTRFKSDEILLFSDGLNNLSEAPKNIGNERIYTITAAVSADHDFLRSIAERSDAVFINLVQTSLQEALSKLKMDQLHFMGFEQKAEIKEYYPKKATAINGSIGVSGKLNGSIHKLTALYGYGNDVTRKDVIRLKPKPSVKFTLKKLWAIKKLNHLYADKKANKKLITEIGISERLVTSNTSLLVLDRVEDYIEHEIVPPTELQKTYFKKLKENQLRKKREKARRINEVYQDYTEQRSWWKEKRKVNDKKVNHENMSLILPPGQQNEELESMDMMMEAPSESRAMERSEQTVSSGTYTLNATAMDGATSTFTFSNSNSTSVNLTTSDGQTEPRGTIHVKGWDPKSPYMRRIKKAASKDLYAVYLNEKSIYGAQPSFYLDVAEFFMENDKKAEAIRILSNIAELELENHSLLRILAHRLLQLKEHQVALHLFKELIDLRPEEPQSYRDLGLAFAELDKDETAVRYLYKVVTGDFDDRFRGIQVIAINEINSILTSTDQAINTSYMDPRFLKSMPVDIRVVLNWDADNTDVDLWVTDPSGEKCFYSNNYTRMGGRISNDFTQGYGPEEFMLKKARKGKYKIQAHYYGTSSQSLEGKATLTVQFFKEYGTNRQVKQEITRRLNVKNEVVDLGTFEF